MLIRMRNNISQAWKQARLLNMIKKGSLTPTEQTKKSWTSLIQSYEDVPEEFKAYYESYRDKKEPFPYTLLLPSFEGFLNRQSIKMISLLEDHLVVLEASGNTFTEQSYPYEGFLFIEFSTILLDAYFKISGISHQDTIIKSTIKFNSINDYLFSPIIECIRQITDAFDDVPQPNEPDKFDKWVHVSYKFMNYAKRSLKGTEIVLMDLFQSEIKSKIFSILGKTYYRTISPALMCILTNKELIIIQEGNNRYKDEKYGGTWFYVPLNCIENLSLAEKHDNLLNLSIHLPKMNNLEFVFSSSFKEDLRKLINQFQAI